MRVTAAVKERTRERILAAGERLFVEKGFERATTRDLASAAKVATGTLFNYFPSKESLAMTILAGALQRGEKRSRRRRAGAESLEEELFALVSAETRAMRPYRAFVGTVVETALSPFARSSQSDEGDRARARHLETVEEIVERHRGPGAATTVSMHLYWSLYVGVLAFWSTDSSPNQEETLVLLDQATRLFASSLPRRSGEAEHGELP